MVSQVLPGFEFGSLPLVNKYKLNRKVFFKQFITTKTNFTQRMDGEESK